MDNLEQINLMMRDMEDEHSDLYQLVFTPLGMDKDSFTEDLTNGINTANKAAFYGGYDTVYAAYTFVNGRQLYFKFSAPKAEMDSAAGSAAPFLEMYNGGVYLVELSPQILLKYVIPYYYKEFGT